MLENCTGVHTPMVMRIFVKIICLFVWAFICFSQEFSKSLANEAGQTLVQVKELAKEKDSRFAKEFQLVLADRVFDHGVSAVPMALGELLVSQEHEVLVDIPQPTDSKITIAGVQSGCGCVTAKLLESDSADHLKIRILIKGIGEEQQFGKAVNVALRKRGKSEYVSFALRLWLIFEPHFPFVAKG